MTKPFNSCHQEILIEDALYTEYDLSTITGEDLATFFHRGAGLDVFCIECKQKSVFRLEQPYGIKFDEEARKLTSTGITTVGASCYRQGEYTGKCSGLMHFIFLRRGDKLVKIGQFPTKADLDLGGLDPVFSKELDKHLRKELGKAVGLRSHGIGVGSFVYLRRIFETLIEEAKEIAQKEHGWSENTFTKARMAEKIVILKDFLPSRLVKNSTLYNILSKGIHSLTEEECLKNFDLVINSILMILKERHEEKEYNKIVNNIQSETSQIN